MKNQTRIALAAALLLSGTAMASAATGTLPSDSVNLSAAQRKTAWNDLNKQAPNQSVTAFDSRIGTFVPSSVKIEPMPGKAAADVPSLRPYDFAMVDHKLVIVDPSNKVIANVLTR